MTLLGGILGVILNIIFPNWLVLLPLSILLAVVGYRTIGKGRVVEEHLWLITSTTSVVAF